MRLGVVADNCPKWCHIVPILLFFSIAESELQHPADSAKGISLFVHSSQVDLTRMYAQQTHLLS